MTTPKRLVHFLEQGTIDLSTVTRVVIDEADTLFENGYETQLDTILAACTNRQHVSLFSATMVQRRCLRSGDRLFAGAHCVCSQVLFFCFMLCRCGCAELTLLLHSPLVAGRVRFCVCVCVRLSVCVCVCVSLCLPARARGAPCTNCSLKLHQVGQ